MFKATKEIDTHLLTVPDGSSQLAGSTVRKRLRLERVVVINDDCVESGGAASVALASAQLLQDFGVPVTFLSGGPGPQPRLSDQGIQLRCLGGAHLMEGSRGSAALRGLFDYRPAAALSDWLDTHDTPGTCYHVHNWHKILSPSIFGPLRRVRSRVVLTAHDYFLACPNGGFFHYPKEHPCTLIPGSIQCCLTNCDRRRYAHKVWRLVRHRFREGLFDLRAVPATVIAVHEGMVPHLVRGGIPRCSIRVLRNPVTPWRTERVKVEQNGTAMFIGRLEEDKGVRHLAIAARHAGIPLRVIGAGPVSEYLESEHPEAELLGWRSRSQIAELIATARMVVLPSRWHETFGLVALEALMSGVPVIISKFALLSHDIVDSGFGLACDPHDVDGLAAIIRAVAENDALARELSLRAYRGARRLAPTPEEWCGALIELYENTLHTPTDSLEG